VIEEDLPPLRTAEDGIVPRLDFGARGYQST